MIASDRKPLYGPGDAAVYQLCGLWRKRVTIVSVEPRLCGLDYVVTWMGTRFPDGASEAKFARVAADFVEPLDA